MDADRLPSTPSFDMGEPPSTLESALAQWVSSQQQLAQLRASHEAFVRAVSHDLRAPLRHLTSFAPLLREAVDTLAAATPGEAADEAQEFLTTMEHSARKMGRMLDALMQLSRAARQPLDLQAVDVHSVLQSCAARTLPTLDAQRWNCGDRPLLLQADPAALHQVLAELLGNAAKFSAGQTIPLVEVDASVSAPGSACIAIRDNGVGFESARMTSTWPPFQRMHRESDFDGVGCGLALAHTLAQRHGAKLHLQSQPGDGCVAFLQWPLAH